MRNLALFLWKHHILFLFLILETGAFYFILKNRNYQNATVINSANAVSGGVYETYSQITNYFGLRSANEVLARENAILLNEVRNSQLLSNDSFYVVNDTTHRQQYVYQMAGVINNSVHKLNNFITIDKGFEEGVREGMGVISAEGVVGIVKNVSRNYASVISLLNSKQAMISVRFKEKGYMGSVIWQGGNPMMATVTDVPRHAIIDPGDTVVTSGGSTIFPSGVAVGTVEKVWIEEGANFFTIDIKLSTDFARLRYVYLVDNLYAREQKALEKLNQQDDL